jgi:isopentenyl diphosphate isomerase/L-lactate dehydrogenase-like FMN-dependent dehydrogenase
LEAEMRIAMALTGTVSVTDINANISRSAVEFNRGR